MAGRVFRRQWCEISHYGQQNANAAKRDDSLKPPRLPRSTKNSLAITMRRRRLRDRYRRRAGLLQVIGVLTKLQPATTPVSSTACQRWGPRDRHRGQAMLLQGLIAGRRPQSSARQISFAYSRMVRSEENQPMRAVLSTAERHHSLLSCQRFSTRAWAAQYDSKSAQTKKRS